MLQQIKRYLWIVLLAVGLEASRGFSLLGPLPPDAGGEPWQVSTIGYNLAYEEVTDPGGPVWLGDVGGPHNLGEEYRHNAPILYYSYDQSFTEGDWFDLNAQAAIDSAFTIMNGMTNVDHFSQALTEFPLTAQHYNYTAEALYLTDIKSVTLHLLVEQMGLADPARYSWTLHDRSLGTACPTTTTYLVVQRNFDGISLPSLQNLAYSAYVNNTLLSYYIDEYCSRPVTPSAEAVTYLTDPSGGDYIPVAANNSQEFQEIETSIYGQEGFITKVPTIYGLQIGGYYSGLTRDDVAGLRYIYTTNNANVEPIPATSLLFGIATNTSGTNLMLLPGNPITIPGTNIYYYFGDLGSGVIGYGDYGYLIAASLTNDPATLVTLFPGLIVASSTNYFVQATNYTYTQYFAPKTGAGQPYPPPIVLVTVTNRHVYLQERYVTTFANVFPYRTSPKTTVKIQTTVVQPQAGAPYPAPLVTNVTTQTINQNIPSGDFFVLPLFHTNICPLDIVKVGLTNVTPFTNFLTSANTNIVTATNTSRYSSTMSLITYFTNFVFEIYPVTCSETAGAVNKYRGLGGVRYVRDDNYYDYLINGQYTTPITNYYTMTAYNITNHLWETRHVVRIVTRPDILLEAADMAVGPGANNFNGTVIRNLNLLFNSSQRVPGLRGPGTIDGQYIVSYNRVGSVFENGPFTDANSFLNPDEVNETTQVPMLQWASYDGTTNAPILYPNTTSLENLENQMAIQLLTTPSGPLVGSAGLPFTAQFNAVGGPFVPQFTWTASGLPPGLSLSDTGTLSGTPSDSGTYDFVLYLRDINGKTVQWNLSITIN